MTKTGPNYPKNHYLTLLYNLARVELSGHLPAAGVVRVEESDAAARGLANMLSYACSDYRWELPIIGS